MSLAQLVVVVVCLTLLLPQLPAAPLESTQASPARTVPSHSILGVSSFPFESTHNFVFTILMRILSLALRMICFLFNFKYIPFIKLFFIYKFYLFLSYIYHIVLFTYIVLKIRVYSLINKI